jgi:hypothetical protein
MIPLFCFVVLLNAWLVGFVFTQSIVSADAGVRFQNNQQVEKQIESYDFFPMFDDQEQNKLK